MKVGVFVPSYLLPGQDAQHGGQVRRFAMKAEELGFDSLFITDHLLTAARFYRVSWTEPMMTLSHVAAVTSRMKLGTSVLVLPTRQPVMLAKEIATLQHLSGGRFIYGIGTGWYPPEFESTGTTRQQRGARTDEVLEASMQLLKGAHVTYEGKYYRMEDITVEPLSHVPPVWVAGGQQYAHAASPDKAEMSPNVLDRICRWDGWIVRPTSHPKQIKEDLAEIDAELSRRGTSRAEKKFTVAHENFCWLSEKASTEEAVEEQKRYMMAVVSDERPWDYIEAVYLTGTIEDIQRRIQERVDAGVEEIFLHTMTADPRQLELFEEHILKPFARVGVRTPSPVQGEGREGDGSFVNLEGRTALVTGGTRGIGLAITRALRREGARVIAIGKAKDQIEAFRKEFGDDPLASAEHADVRDRASLEAVREKLDGLDILVPNAGVNTRVKALELEDAALHEMLDTNLYGVFVTCQVFAPLLFVQPGGRVVITSSISAIHGQELRAAYAATKAGLSGLVRALAVEWGPLGVNVNAVGPGIIETPLTKAYMEQFPERVDAAIAHTPLRRIGTPEDIADVVLFLASDASRFMTGQTVYVDGGVSAGSSWW